MGVMFLIESGILFHIEDPLYIKDCWVKFNRQYFGKTIEPFLFFLVLLFKMLSSRICLNALGNRLLKCRYIKFAVSNLNNFSVDITSFSFIM